MSSHPDLEDTGFLDLTAVREAYSAIIIRSRAEAHQLVNQQIEAQSDKLVAAPGCAHFLGLRDLYRRFQAAFGNQIGGDNG